MKRKIGNGSWSRQWVYVLVNFPYIWVSKTGITGRNVDQRLKEIDDSAPGWDFKFFSLPILFAYPIEQFLHSIYRKLGLSVKFKGSGKTERFLVITIIPSVIIVFIVFLLEWALYFALGFSFLYMIINK